VGVEAGALGTETLLSSPPHAASASAAETATAAMRTLVRSIQRTVAIDRAQLQTAQRPAEHEQTGGAGAGPRGPQRRSQSRAPGSRRSDVSPGQLRPASDRAKRAVSVSVRVAIEWMIADKPRARSSMPAG
jgi:hypothetical protein